MRHDQYYIDQYQYQYYKTIIIKLTNLASSYLILKSVNYNYLSHICDVYLPIYSFKFIFSSTLTRYTKLLNTS